MKDWRFKAVNLIASRSEKLFTVVIILLIKISDIS